MKVFTDSILFAERMVSPRQKWKTADFSTRDSSESLLIDRFFPGQSVYQNVADAGEDWTLAFLVKEASFSQFDVLVEFTRDHPDMTDGIICLAGTGHGFHGQKKRHWVAMEGNIHLTVHLAPMKKVECFGVGLPVLAAVSVVESIDLIEGLEGKASIKWINDVLCDGAKVAGFLVHTASMGETVASLVLGVGLNVEKTPELIPEPHVPKVASLREFVSESTILNQREILSILLDRLSRNYESLLQGQWAQLLDVYRKRSMVVGRCVRILTDPENGRPEELSSGRVYAIGENLELWLDGIEEPIKKGRLILTD